MEKEIKEKKVSRLLGPVEAMILKSTEPKPLLYPRLPACRGLSPYRFDTMLSGFFVYVNAP